jgi:hypothetical protein
LPVLLLVAPETAVAEKVPEILLSKDFDQCVLQVRKNAHISKTRRLAYCTCVKDEIRAQFGLDHYMALTVALQAGDVFSAESRRLTSVAATCAGKSFN